MAKTPVKVWLDDLRQAPPGWAHLRTAQEAIGFLQNNISQIEEMSFDHDLGYQGPRDGTPEDGHDVAKVLEELAFLGKVREDIKLSIHSSNGPGIKEIKLALGSALRFLNRDIREVRVLNYEQNIKPLFSE